MPRRYLDEMGTEWMADVHYTTVYYCLSALLLFCSFVVIVVMNSGVK